MPRETEQKTREDHTAPQTGESFSFDKWRKQLDGESYEESRAALTELDALRNWRKQKRSAPVREVYSLIERVLESQKQPADKEEQEEKLADIFDEATLASRAMTPRVRDVYLALSAAMTGQTHRIQFESTTERLKEFSDDGLIETLADPSVNYQDKQDILTKRLNRFLEGQLSLDRRAGHKAPQKKEKRESHPVTPPPARERSKPSMDEMQRLKEGEVAPAMWQIMQARGGYFPEQSFDTWDKVNNEWAQSEYRYESVALVPFQEGAATDKNKPFTLTAELIPGQWTRLPGHKGYALSDRIQISQGELLIQQDQNGDTICFVRTELATPVTCEITFVPSNKPKKQEPPKGVPNFSAQFSPETQAKLQDITKCKQGNVARGRALAAHTMRRLTYSNESKYNEIYDTYPDGYIAAIEHHGKADCDVANTYFAALCAELKIPVRHRVGHMVKGKDDEGGSRITSGTGHAWSEVWDEQNRVWERIDATPPGDPQLQEDQEQRKSEAVPGDYGNSLARLPTEEELEALRKKLAQHVEKLSYTAEERRLAASAGIELAEARKVVSEILAAEDTRLHTKDRERVIDVLGAVFNEIVQWRKNPIPIDRGPVTQAEGGEEIELIVAHTLARQAGIKDPATRFRQETQEKTELTYGGIDVYVIGDKSGSMGQTTDEGEEKWKMQRRAIYLTLTSLYNFSRNADRAGLQPLHEQALEVRSESISFRGDGPADIDEDKPLGSVFSDVDKVRLWHGLTEQGSGNGDTAALNYIYEQIKVEVEKESKLAERIGKKANPRIRLIIACSDGMPDSEAGVRDAVARLGEVGCVVVGVGLTETATQVPVIYNTPHSRGDYAKTIDDLPIIIAKHLVMEAIKLFPPEARQQAATRLQSVIAKLSRS